jgi:hypothetical protein
MSRGRRVAWRFLVSQAQEEKVTTERVRAASSLGGQEQHIHIFAIRNLYMAGPMHVAHGNSSSCTATKIPFLYSQKRNCTLNNQALAKLQVCVN